MDHTLAADVPWSQLVPYRLIGLIVGGLLLFRAIRSMFGRRR